VGIPGRVVKRGNKKVSERVHPRETMDQVHLPDPVRMEMCKIRIRIEALEDGKGKLTDEQVEVIKLERCINCKDNPNPPDIKRA
jgi:serine O-acetyltransferase